jgi:hypothetical protein
LDKYKLFKISKINFKNQLQKSTSKKIKFIQYKYCLALMLGKILFCKKRFGKTAGKWKTGKSRTIRSNNLETLNIKLKTKDYFCKKIHL